MKINFPALIVGLGKSGLAIQRLIRHYHPQAVLKTYDFKDPKADFSTFEQVAAFQPKTLVVSPGVPLASPWIQDLIKKGCRLTSELDLSLPLLEKEKVIGITGSMGKSTTTSLLGAAVESLSENNFFGGNLGYPLADYVFEVATGQRARGDWVVLELSSYQLENCKSLSCAASLLTALSQNHLERYESLDHYYETKWALSAATKGPFFLNYDNSEIRRWCGSRLNENTFPVKSSEFSAHPMKMVGLHNRENLALALSVAQYFKWPQSAIRAIENYPGLPHRLELVGEKNGVRWINDSKATTIESVVAAVSSCLPDLKPEATLHLLAGGRDKNLPWEDLARLKSFRRVQFYFFGECADIAQKKSLLRGPQFKTLGAAISSAKSQLKSGDIFLLSPGGSSLDEFKNFEERGDYFRKLSLE